MLINEKVSVITISGSAIGSSPNNMQKFYAEHLNCNAIIRSNIDYDFAKIRIYSLGPCVKQADSEILKTAFNH